MSTHTIMIDSDEEFETQTITDTYRFFERGTVFRSAQKKAWCGIKPGCHRAGCACPVLMHDLSSNSDDRSASPTIRLVRVVRPVSACCFV